MASASTPLDEVASTAGVAPLRRSSRSIAHAPQRSPGEQCRVSLLPWCVVVAATAYDGCVWAICRRTDQQRRAQRCSAPLYCERSGPTGRTVHSKTITALEMIQNANALRDPVRRCIANCWHTLASLQNLARHQCYIVGFRGPEAVRAARIRSPQTVPALSLRPHYYHRHAYYHAALTTLQ
jgi:hypothetical protein